MNRHLVLASGLTLTVLVVVSALLFNERAHRDATMDIIARCTSNIVECGGSVCKMSDAWGRMIVCETNSVDGEVVIRSAGPDGVYGSRDDVIGELSLDSNRNYQLNVHWKSWFDGNARLDAMFVTEE